MYSYIITVEFFKFMDSIYLLSNNSIVYYNTLYTNYSNSGNLIPYYSGIYDTDNINYRTLTYVIIVLSILKF